MSVTYKNAPLVELIAELRWGPLSESIPPGRRSPIRISLPHPADEDIFLHYAAVIAQKGYGRVERLIPPGTPVPMSMPACRFRPTEADKSSPLFQIGKGVFTANGLPPDYQSWNTFAPVVRVGLDSLFEAYRRAHQSSPKINEALIRYIDVFNKDLTGGRDAADFLSEIIGVRLDLPMSITSLAKSASSAQNTIRLEQEVDVGLMTITFAPATKDNEDAVLLDTSILMQREIGDDMDAAISALTEARGVIHNLFLALTTSLHDAMGPTT